MKGFTLLEVILAVMIFSVLMAALYGTFFMTLRAVQGLDDYMIRLQEAREAIDSMRKEIEAAFFPGKNDRINFKIIDRDHFGKQTSTLEEATFSGYGHGLKLVSYFVAEKKDGKLSLVKRILPAFGKVDAKPVEVEILEDVKEFSIEADNGREAVKTWDTTVNPGLPLSVRIALTLHLKDGDITLREIVYPRISSR